MRDELTSEVRDILEEAALAEEIPPEVARRLLNQLLAATYGDGRDGMPLGGQEGSTPRAGSPREGAGEFVRGSRDTTARRAWILGGCVTLAVAGALQHVLYPRTTTATRPITSALAAPDILASADVVDHAPQPDLVGTSVRAFSPASLPDGAPAKSRALMATQPARKGEVDDGDDLALVAEAQGALSGGNYSRALALAETHRARFPRGTMREERDAIRLLALCGMGRLAEARALLPLPAHSPYAGRVRAACGAQDSPSPHSSR